MIQVRLLSVQQGWHRDVSDRVRFLNVQQFAAVPRIGDDMETSCVRGRVRDVVWHSDGTPSVYVEVPRTYP